MMLTGLATLAMALFTGAAVHIAAVEQPARLECQWRASSC